MDIHWFPDSGEDPAPWQVADHLSPHQDPPEILSFFSLWATTWKIIDLILTVAAPQVKGFFSSITGAPSVAVVRCILLHFLSLKSSGWWECHQSLSCNVLPCLLSLCFEGTFLILSKIVNTLYCICGFKVVSKMSSSADLFQNGCSKGSLVIAYAAYILGVLFFVSCILFFFLE